MPGSSEVTAINRQKFLAELAKLLSFMYEEDRRYALDMYERMFDIAEGSEQWLIQNLMSPTRQAVIIARSYNAKERKLSVSAEWKEEEEDQGGETPPFVLAINKIFDDLFPDNENLEETDSDQVSFFEQDAINKETKKLEVPEVNYTKVNSNNFITVTYKDAEGMNPIVIKINLDDNWKDSWKFNDKNGHEKFYYKKVLTSGKKTPNLIKSVKLEADQDAYYAFDYNLDVKIESIQIGTGDADENGKANEAADIVAPVNGEWEEEVTATYNYSTDGKYSPVVDDELTWTFK